MQGFTGPIHLPGVFEGHLEATSQRQQSTSSTPAWWRNWNLTQELSWHSRRAPAGTKLGLGAMLGSPGFTGIQEELGTMASYARKPRVLCTELLQTLQSLGTLEGSGKICWRCYFRGWVLSHMPSTIWMSGRRRQSLEALGLLKSLLLVWSR